MTSAETTADLRRRRYNSTVVSLKKVHSDLMVVRIRPDFPIQKHEAGQYCTLGMGMWEPRFPGCQEEDLSPADETKLVRRAYSLSCSVLDADQKLLDLASKDWLEFYIVLVRETDDTAKPPGLTPRLFMLREGDRLQVGERITGHFTLDGVKPDDSVVFLGTGTGEAPHNYMTWQLLRQGHRGPIVSACCVRYLRDLGYLKIHEELMRQYPNYRYLPLTTREAANSNAKVYVQDLITSGELAKNLGRALDPRNTHVFLCGNPKMIGVPVKDRETGQRHFPKPQGVIEILETQYGFQCDAPAQKIRGNIHFEEYW